MPLHKVHRFQLAETSNAGKLSGNVDCRLSTIDCRLSTRLPTVGVQRCVNKCEFVIQSDANSGVDLPHTVLMFRTETVNFYNFTV